ncbi:heme o synthase [Pelagibacteraceae bacterium]|nr:heme o synthase [Pelagibacteraceae bacterium]
MNTQSSLARYSNNFFLRKIKGYFELMKPRVMSLVIFTAIVGMFLAPGEIPVFEAIIVITAIAIGAGSSAAINMWFDEDIDKAMERTKLRPIPLGIVSKNEALVLGIFTGIISLLLMQWFSNSLATSLLLFTILFYIFIYTFWLKRTTSMNIVIGGAAGAIPPIIGWAAVNTEITFLPISMFLIIFFWTPPHFWALSVYRFNDYKIAKIPMLPNVKSIEDTKKQIVFYSIILIISSYLPCFDNSVGSIYIFMASILNYFLFINAIKLKKSSEQKSKPNKEGLKFFALTIFYLFSLFSALLIDNLV